MAELKRRRTDKKLGNKISELLHGDIPSVLAGRSINAVLFRQLITPNYEVRRFFHLIGGIRGLDPLFWEYYEDKFTSNNEWKHSLGKIMFFMGIGKKAHRKVEHITVVDFNKYDGKKISQVKTIWGQSLVKFHHQLFDKTYKRLSRKLFFDSSEWFRRNGGAANEYYSHLFRLFVQNAILFENFMLDVKEISFSKDIFLPAFIKVFQETEYKPLIVALEPTEVEEDGYWLCHPSKSKDFVDTKTKSLITRLLIKLSVRIQRRVRRLVYT